MASKIAARRGAFILFEGVDRCGKTTQCTRLLKWLEQEDGGGLGAGRVEFMRFPDRTTSIGSTINAYLQNTEDLDDRAIHLLFAANRWEAAQKIREKLNAGITLVVDRYSYSGVAFSSAKAGLDVDWCKSPETGLPAPDVILFLDMSIEDAKKRGQFGEERYETEKFQRDVRQKFKEIMGSEDGNVPWHVVDAARTIEEVEADVQRLALETVSKIGEDEPIKQLW